MLKIAILAVLVAAAYGCCTPQQWEGRIGSITGTVTNGQSMTMQLDGAVSYDFMNKMLAYNFEYNMNGQDIKNKTIINYQTKMMYMISDMGPCSVFNIDMDMMEACTPPDAQEAGNFYFGVEDHKLQATAYKFMIPVSDQESIEGIVSVTQMECVPITEIVYGTVGQTKMMTNVGFVDVTPGIQDPTVFDPPAACNFMKPKGLPIKIKSMSVFGLPSVHKH